MGRRGVGRVGEVPGQLHTLHALDGRREARDVVRDVGLLDLAAGGDEEQPHEVRDVDGGEAEERHPGLEDELGSVARSTHTTE